MNKTITFFIISFIIFNVPLVLNARENEKAYVSDVLILTLRKGPGRDFATIRTIESGEALIILTVKILKLKTKNVTKSKKLVVFLTY